MKRPALVRANYTHDRLIPKIPREQKITDLTKTKDPCNHPEARKGSRCVKRGGAAHQLLWRFKQQYSKVPPQT